MNQYTNSNGYDSITRTYHCGCCDTPLEMDGEVLVDHVMIEWTHLGYIKFAGKIATDELGKTVEGVYAVQPRVALSRIPIQDHLRYCADCFPLAGEVCPCGGEVDNTAHYSKATVLWKRADGYNGGLQFYTLHHTCLPKEFDELRAFVAKHGVNGNS